MAPCPFPPSRRSQRTEANNNMPDKRPTLSQRDPKLFQLLERLEAMLETLSEEEDRIMLPLLEKAIDPVLFTRGNNIVPQIK